MSKVGEISTIEIIEGYKVYEAMYIMGMKAAIRLQLRPRRPDSKHKLNRREGRYKKGETKDSPSFNGEYLP